MNLIVRVKDPLSDSQITYTESIKLRDGELVQDKRKEYSKIILL